MLFTRTVVKSFNPALLHEEVAALGIQSIAFKGFVRVSGRQFDAAPVTQDIGTITVGGVTTVLTAVPGELEFEAPSDPGAALDTVLTNHVHTNDSVRQAKGALKAADKVLIADALTRPVLTNPEIQAIGRIVLNQY
jgi:hypothetical protein